MRRTKIIALPSPNPPPASRDRAREQWALLGRVLLGILARRQAQETATAPERTAPERTAPEAG